MAANLEAVLSLLRSFRGKSQVQSFLEDNRLPHSGTWNTVEDRIREATEDGNVEIDGLIELLEEIEEHGNQYLFFYDLVAAPDRPLPTIESMTQALTPAELRTVLNAIHVIEEPPNRATLVSARFGDGVAKFKWVQRRTFYRRVDETEVGNRLRIEYEIVPVRAVDLAILDLNNNKAYLCIQRVESGIQECHKYLPQMNALLQRFLGPQGLVPLDLSRLMARLADKTFVEVRRRRHQVRDDTGCVVDAMSATERADVFGGAFYSAARANYRGPLTDLHANVYWVANAVQLVREIHTLFPYRSFPNAVIFTQRCSKRERDYVLSRIEQIARA